MSERKATAGWTPGPWRVLDAGRAVGTPERDVAYTRPEDAPLISAAPDLYEVARRALAFASGEGNDTDRTLREAARAALAKAEGSR